MDNFYDPKPKRNIGKKILSVLLVLAIIAITAFSAIGIYKLILEEQNKEQLPPAQSEVQQEAPESEKVEEEIPEKSPEEQAPVVEVPGYDLDITPAQVAEKVIPSVVCIQNYQQEKAAFPFAQTLQQEPKLTLAAEGSGVVYTQDGYIITNAHVVSGNALLKVVLSDETVHEAKLIGMDEDTDLALIKIEAEGLTAIEIGDYESLKVGDFVMAVGNPGGMEFSSSVTFGIVSAKDRPMDIDNGYTVNTIQTDAAINPGNSGGALVDMDGRLIGINSAKYVATGYEGLGFSITIEETLPIVEDLKNYGKVTGRSMLGVNGIMIDEMVAAYYELTPGFYIDSIDNPNAGALEAGDVITAVDGAKVTSDTVIKNVLHGKPAGTKVQIQYWRDGAHYDTTITLVSADA